MLPAVKVKLQLLLPPPLTHTNPSPPPPLYRGKMMIIILMKNKSYCRRTSHISPRLVGVCVSDAQC